MNKQIKVNNQIRVGLVLNYLNLLLGSIIPLAYTPVMLRLLGQSEYGLYKLSSSLTGYLSLLSLGIASAVVRNLIKARTEGGIDEEQRVFSLFLLIYKIIAILILIVGVVLSLNLDRWYVDSLSTGQLNRMQILVVIMAIHTALSFLIGPYNSVLTAHERYVFLQGAGVVLTILGPLLMLITLLLGYGSVGIAVCSLVVSLSANTLYVWYVRKKLKLKVQYHDLPWNLTKEILSFSFWVFLADLTSILYNSTDTLLIGARPELGTSAVAIYSVGVIITSMTVKFSAALGSMLMPRVTKMCFEGASNECLTDYGIKVGRLQLLIVALIISGFISFGRPFIEFYAGSDYSMAYYVCILTVIPIAIPLLQSVFLNVIMARSQHRFRSITYLCIAILNVIATYIIIPYKGIVGASLITGLSSLIGHGVIMNIYYWKKAGMNILRFWRSLLDILFVPTLLCISMIVLNKYITYSLITLAIWILLYTCLYIVFQFILAMDNNERILVLSFIKKR